MSKSGSNTITGTAASEHLNGGSGADIINGMGGNDRVNAGSGDDIMDGGSGNDIVNGDSGDDLGIYVLSENIGSTDVYDGGSGRDTLQLVLTRAQWQSPAVQADIARFLTFLAQVTNPVNGQASNANFTFSFGLTVSKFEALQVMVDGVAFDPRDQAVTLVNDVMSAGEETASVSVNVLANDSVPDLIATLTNTQPSHGTVTLTRTTGTGATADTASFVYTPNPTYWQYLAAGQTATDTFTYSVTDSDGDISTATVTVTITGSNDGPTLGAVVSSGSVVEDGAVSAAGTIAFADADLRDAHTATSSANGSDYLGSFTTTVTDNGAGDGAGSVAWDFAVDNAAIQYLAAGQTLTQTYTVTVDDGQGGTVTQSVTVTITGANDAPTITASVSNGAVTEDGVTTAGGAIAFADVDLRDGHAVSSTANGPGYLGVFTAQMTDDGAGDGSGSVAWNFSVDNAAVQYLAAGQTLTQTYTVAVADGQGGTVNQTVTVTLTGTNDAPIITTADVQGGVTETQPVTGVPAGATPVMTDVESNNTFASAQVINRADMRVAPNTNLADPTDPSVRIEGAISTSADQDVFRIDLQPGETLTLDIDFAGIIPGVGGLDSFVFIYDAAGNLLNFNDDSSTSLGGGGSTSTMDSFLQFVATLGGTYYIVVKDFDLQGQSSAGTYALNVSVDSQNLQLTDTGAMTFADVDLRDGHTVSVAAQGTGYLGGLTAVVSNASTNDGSGGVQWTFSVANAAVQFLAAGETRTQTYVVTVNDGQGGTASETVTVTITGENDRPTISTAFSSGQVVENAALAASGVIAFDDVDLIDAHSVSSAADGAGYLGTFSASISDPATGAGAGEITWTFSASDADLQYLAAGQSLLQRYIVTVDDGNGGTTQQLVNITIVGTNDAPTVTSAVSSGAVAEDGVTSAAGAIAFADVDLRDGHTVAAIADNTSYLGTFTTSVTDNGAGDGAGSVSWNFAVDNAATQHLTAGQTLTQTYTVTVSDGQGGTVSQPVTITITGANDAPVVQNVAAVATEDGAPVTAAFSADDVDSDDDTGSLTYVVTSTPSEGSVVNNGDGTFSFHPGDDFQNLAAGETRDITFGYNAIDSHGAATPGSVTITITGVNDAPVTNDLAIGGSAVGAGFPLVFGGYYNNYYYSDENNGQVIFSLVDTNNDGIPDAPGSSAELPHGSQNYYSDVNYGLAVGDIDGDGDVDVVTANNEGVISFTNVGDTDGDGVANFTRTVIASGFNGYDVALADLNGDGRLDVVTSSYNGLVQLLNTGDANGDGLINDFNQTSLYTTGQQYSYGLTTADMNGDGRMDVLVASYYGVSELFLNLGDTDSDGDVDYLVQQFTENYYNYADMGVDTGDLDGDGDQDFVLSRWNGQDEVVYINDGDTDGDGDIEFRTFEVQTGGYTMESELVDIDGDGDLDLVTSDAGYGDVRIAYNNGDTNNDGLVDFTVQSALGGSYNYSYGLAVGDVDGDGDMDIVIPSLNNGYASYLQNQGDTDGDGQLNFTPVQMTGVDMSWDAEFTPQGGGGGGGGSGAYEDGPTVTGSFDGDDIDSDDDSASLTYTITSAPSEGSVVNNGDGTFGFSPGSDFQDLGQGETRTVTFTYTATDAHGVVSSPSTVTVRVAGTNDAPVATLDTATTAEETPVTINVLDNDSDVDGDTLAVTHVNGVNIAINGTVALGDGASVRLNADGTLTYFPAANATGLRSFAYTVTDGLGAATTATVEVSLTQVNDAPVANADSVTTNEDTPVTFDVRANDTDIDSAARTVTHINGSAIAAGGSVTLADGGLVGMNTDGTLTYTPALNASGARSFSYTISDGDGGSASSTVNLTVNPVNDAPVANPDSVTVNEDTSVNFDVRANDTDIDGGSRTVTHINGSAISTGGQVILSDGGRVVLNSNGTLTYTPAANANGARTFDYTISDGQGGSATSSVNVTVNPVNDRPVAVNDVASATEAGGVQNGTAGLSATGNVLANDTDVDDTLLVVSAERTGTEAGSGSAGTVGSPLNGAYGTLTLNANGSYSYVVNQTNTAVQALNTGGTLTDTFTYTTRDAAGLTDTAQLTVTINGANDAPVAQNVTLQANQLGNGGFDASPNFSGWTVNTATSGLVSASNGTATIDRGGTIIAGDAAVAVLQFTGNVPSGFGTAQGPSITSAAFAGQAGDTVRFVYQLSSGGDYAIGTGYIRDAVTGVIVQTIFNYQTPFTGSTGVVTQDVVLTGSGNYTIDFRVGSYDATGGRFVGARLDLGFAGILRNGVSEDESFTFAASNFTAGATDPDGNTLTVVSVGTSANGATVTLNADGTVLYNPVGHLDFLAAGQQLVDTFQYTLSDGRGGFSTATASVTVIGKDEAPAAMVIANGKGKGKGKGGEEVLPDSTDKDDSGPVVLPGASEEPETEGDRSTDLFTVSDDDGMLTIDPDGVLSFGSLDGDDDFLVLSGDVVDQPLVLPGLADDFRSNLDLTPRLADNDSFLTIDQDGQLNFGTAVVGQDLFVLAGDLVDQPLVLPGEGIDEMFDFQPLSDLFAARHGAMHLTVTEDGQVLGGENWIDTSGLHNWA